MVQALPPTHGSFHESVLSVSISNHFTFGRVEIILYRHQIDVTLRYTTVYTEYNIPYEC